MRYEKLVKDFTERTMDNLAAIDKLVETQKKKGKKPTVFETTQLINSCLGLIVMPKEIWLQRIPKTSLEELEAEGWPIPSLIDSSQQRASLNLRHLVKYLRNAVAHWHIEFTHDDHDHIDGLKMWNEEENGSRRWESVLGVRDLRILVKKFSEMIVQINDEEIKIVEGTNK